MPPVRRSLAAVSLVLLVPALGACGFNYQTDKVYQPAVGVNNRQGEVDVLNAVVVAGGDGQGTFVTTLSNENEDKSAELSNVAAASSSGVEAKLLAPVTVPPGGFVNLADAGAIAVTGDKVVPGNFLRFTLTFDGGQESQVNVPVVARQAQWTDVTPADPSPTPPNDTASAPAASPAPAPSASATP